MDDDEEDITIAIPFFFCKAIIDTNTSRRDIPFGIAVVTYFRSPRCCLRSSSLSDLFPCLQCIEPFRPKEEERDRKIPDDYT
jgi:hypothetical protein